MALLQTFSRGHPRPPPKIPSLATAPAAAYATTPSRPASLSTAPSRQAAIGHPLTHPPTRASPAATKEPPLLLGHDQLLQLHHVVQVALGAGGGHAVLHKVGHHVRLHRQTLPHHVALLRGGARGGGEGGCGK